MRRYFLITVVAIIFSLGLVMIYNTTSAEILDMGSQKNPYTALTKQFLYASAGFIVAYVVRELGARRFIKMTPYLIYVFSFLLFLCLVPGIGKEVNGSRRWLGFGPMTFQPSEFVKYVTAGFFIYQLSHYRDQVPFSSFFKTLLFLAIPIGLVALEPNNGTAGVMVLTLVALCFLMRIPFRFWALPLIVVFIVGGTVAWQLPYVQGRLKVYLDPEYDLLGRGHQPHQAKIAAGSGQLLGKGPGNSLQKLSYLPEAQNDYIAAIYGEEFGFVGMGALISLYLVIAYVGFSEAYQSKNREESLMISSATFLITYQAFMNMGVVSGLLPSTGLNLPFFSQGGTSLIANIIGIGLILQRSKETWQSEY